MATRRLRVVPSSGGDSRGDLGDGDLGDGDLGPVLDEALDRIRVLAGAVWAARDVHTPVRLRRPPWRAGRVVCAECRRAYPCPTVRALTAAGSRPAMLAAREAG
jgi:hypothetical protein